MKRLILLRHAKTVPHGSAPDPERKLASLGRVQMDVVSRALEARAKPAHALVSPAARTRETWGLAKSALGDPPVTIEDDIYEGSAEDLLAVIRRAPADATGIVLVGHNPGLRDVTALLLDRTGEPDYGDLSAFPTGAFAVLDFPIERWSDTEPGGAQLVEFITPASLGVRSQD